MAHERQGREKSAHDDSRTGVWSTIFGLAEVPIRHIGEALHPYIPDWMKTPAVETAIGTIKAYIQGKHLHGFGGAVVERVTDILDVAFTGGHQAAQKAAAWVKGFLADARKRLAEAAPADKKATKQQLLAEFRLYKKFYETVEQALAGTPHQPVPIDWDDIEEKLNNLLAPPIRGLGNWLGNTPLAKPKRTPFFVWLWRAMRPKQRARSMDSKIAELEAQRTYSYRRISS